MGLFPQQFIDDLRQQANIVSVIQDYVPLKQVGNTHKGLCPFHSEKTPSFTVHADKGFFHCFGCHAGGDVFKFLELHEKVGFQDAVRMLAQKFGVAIPETDGSSDDARQDASLREALLKVHEIATAFFREQLAAPSGARARRQLADRGRRCPHHRTARARLRAGRTWAEGPPRRARIRRGLVAAKRLDAQARQRRHRRPVSQSPDDPDLPRGRIGHRLRGPGDGRRTATEVPELAGNADLLEGAHAVRSESDEIAHPAAGLRGPRRGLFRFRAGVSDAGCARRRLLRDRVDAAAGPAASPVHHQGGLELRPRRGRTGGGGQIVQAAWWRRDSRSTSR